MHLTCTNLHVHREMDDRLINLVNVEVNARGMLNKELSELLCAAPTLQHIKFSEESSPLPQSLRICLRLGAYTAAATFRHVMQRL